MAATATLVFAGNNRLRYLIEGDGEGGGAVTIPNDGGVSPDLATDCLPGALKQIINARTTGIGTIAAGALTQAQARALLLSDGVAANVGNAKVPRAICRLAERTDNGSPAMVDADVDMDGDPVIIVTVASGAETYLDIELANGVGIGQ